MNYERFYSRSAAELAPVGTRDVADRIGGRDVVSFEAGWPNEATSPWTTSQTWWSGCWPSTCADVVCSSSTHTDRVTYPNETKRVIEGIRCQLLARINTNRFTVFGYVFQNSNDIYRIIVVIF